MVKMLPLTAITSRISVVVGIGDKDVPGAIHRNAVRGKQCGTRGRGAITSPNEEAGVVCQQLWVMIPVEAETARMTPLPVSAMKILPELSTAMPPAGINKSMGYS